MLTLYSFIWSVLISSAFMLILHFLYKNDKIVLKFDPVVTMVVLFFPLVRLLIPLEFPRFQYLLEDKIVYAAIFNNYVASGRPKYPSFILCALWGCGCIVLILHFIRQVAVFHYLLKNYSSAVSESVYEQLEKIKNPGEKIKIKYLSGITSPMLAGISRPTIYLPKDYLMEDDLQYILLHEYTHWKEKDLWIKITAVILKIIFWWNPVVWLISRDLERFIEIRCDKNATAGLSEIEKLCYTETILKIARKNSGVCHEEYALGMSQNLGAVSLRQRLGYLLNSASVHAKRVLHTLLIFMISFCVYFLSYYFLLQPSWNTPQEELWEDDIVFVADSSNSYLVKQRDGSYLFYVGEGQPLYVSEEEVEAGYYSDYPIKKSEADK